MKNRTQSINLKPFQCIDIDECEHGVVKFSDGIVQRACQRNAYCENAFGYYMCHCISGPFFYHRSKLARPTLSLVYTANYRSSFLPVIAEFFFYFLNRP